MAHGRFEGSHPTTHDAPTYKVHDAAYYCVANIPGAVPQTSTAALTNAALPYALCIADKGWMRLWAGAGVDRECAVRGPTDDIYFTHG